ncbi:M23 family metallopeptidase [Thermicanus aegyptius]|uniref:M23 family metallopeptidase n=1 Tax=Thermicanus aegyptius TaxID=94009 RepID=UPI00034CC3DB|nr:M23 family metallopeptidase [Thermicanus aegyptius]
MMIPEVMNHMDKEKEATTAKEVASQEEKKDLRRSNPTGLPKSWKRFLSKKWVFPAVYLGTLALILALIFWYPSSTQPTLDKDGALPDLVNNTDQGLAGKGEESMPVATPEEHLAWPVREGLQFSIARTFYDDQAGDEQKAQAVVHYAGGYYPNTGIDITANGESFDVIAAGSGDVIRAEKDPAVGNVIWIQHGNNRVTVYESLDELKVKKGDKVKQGDLLGKAGRNNFGKDLGVHLHFEVRDQDTPLNPIAILPEMK